MVKSSWSKVATIWRISGATGAGAGGGTGATAGTGADATNVGADEIGEGSGFAVDVSGAVAAEVAGDASRFPAAS